MDDLDAELNAEIRRKRRRGLVLGAILLGVCIAPCAVIAYIIEQDVERSSDYDEEHSHVATPEQLAAVRVAATMLEAEATQRRATWSAAAAGAARFGPTAERCRAVHDSGTPFAATTGSGTFEDPAQLTAGRARLEGLRAQLARENTAEWHANATNEARAIGSPEHWREEILVFIDERRAPHLDDTLPGMPSYEPGAMHGRAYLYDHRLSEIVCVATLHYEQGGEVDYRTTLGSEETDAFLAMHDAFEAGLRPAIRGLTWYAAAAVEADPAPLE